MGWVNAVEENKIGTRSRSFRACSLPCDSAVRLGSSPRLTGVLWYCAKSLEPHVEHLFPENKYCVRSTPPSERGSVAAMLSVPPLQCGLQCGPGIFGEVDHAPSSWCRSRSDTDVLAHIILCSQAACAVTVTVTVEPYGFNGSGTRHCSSVDQAGTVYSWNQSSPQFPSISTTNGRRRALSSALCPATNSPNTADESGPAQKAIAQQLGGTIVRPVYVERETHYRR